MTALDKTILESYFLQLEKLSSFAKLELIERLTKSIRKDQKKEMNKREKLFYESAGSFGSEKSSDEINKEIKESRKFKNRDFVL